jgi:hypothetical protein
MPGEKEEAFSQFLRRIVASRGAANIQFFYTLPLDEVWGWLEVTVNQPNL